MTSSLPVQGIVFFVNRCNAIKGENVFIFIKHNFRIYPTDLENSLSLKYFFSDRHMLRYYNLKNYGKLQFFKIYVRKISEV